MAGSITLANLKAEKFEVCNTQSLQVATDDVPSDDVPSDDLLVQVNVPTELTGVDCFFGKEGEPQPAYEISKGIIECKSNLTQFEVRVVGWKGGEVAGRVRTPS